MFPPNFASQIRHEKIIITERQPTGNIMPKRVPTCRGGTGHYLPVLPPKKHYRRLYRLTKKCDYWESKTAVDDSARARWKKVYAKYQTELKRERKLNRRRKRVHRAKRKAEKSATKQAAEDICVQAQASGYTIVSDQVVVD